MKEVFAHKGELVVGVEEVAASGTQQDMHRESAALDRRSYEAVARCEASFAEGGAKFDAVRSAFARGKASLDTLRTELEDNLAH
jgi:hypothetical protein